MRSWYNMVYFNIFKLKIGLNLQCYKIENVQTTMLKNWEYSKFNASKLRMFKCFQIEDAQTTNLPNGLCSNIRSSHLSRF